MNIRYVLGPSKSIRLLTICQPRCGAIHMHVLANLEQAYATQAPYLCLCTGAQTCPKQRSQHAWRIRAAGTGQMRHISGTIIIRHTLRY